MNEISEAPERSGGIDIDHSDIQAQDVIGRDKIELHLPPIARKGCYAQLSENIRFAVFLGTLLLLIYAVFQQLNRPSVSEQTPTPTVEEPATPTATIEPVTTVDDQRAFEQTVPAVPPPRSTTTVVSPDEGTPMVMVTPTDGSAVIVSPTSTPRRVTATATRDAANVSTPVPAQPTPTPCPTLTPTPKPATLTPSPRPPTATPRPPTSTLIPCPSATVRLGPVAKLATVGDTFGVSVLVSCAVNLAGYQVELRFDPSVVIVKDANNAGFLSSAGGSVFVTSPDVNNNAGEATIGAVVLRPGPYPSGSGTLASFTLEAVAPGSSDLNLGVSLSNVNAQPMSVGVSGGAVIVQPAPTAIPGSP